MRGPSCIAIVIAKDGKTSCTCELSMESFDIRVDSNTEVAASISLSLSLTLTRLFPGSSPRYEGMVGGHADGSVLGQVSQTRNCFQFLHNSTSADFVMGVGNIKLYPNQVRPELKQHADSMGQPGSATRGESNLVGLKVRSEGTPVGLDHPLVQAPPQSPLYSQRAQGCWVHINSLEQGDCDLGACQLIQPRRKAAIEVIQGNILKYFVQRFGAEKPDREKNSAEIQAITP